MPACAAAPGMPQTTLEASSWAITLPPAARSPAAAHAVRAHAGQDHGENAALPDIDRRGEQRVDRGLAEIDQRAVIEGDRGRAVTYDRIWRPPGAR